ncbi:MAG TPA: phosphoribosyltransferase family protein [Acidimicrobiia bacterium]|nr:phosphoribosyltransferase family protein [Acidimicrobiia bacterium]
MPPPPGLDAVHAAVVYDGAARELVARLKYRNARTAAGLLVDLVDGVLPPEVDAGAVTWVPASRERHRGFGFEHAELLARGLARRRGVAARRLLRRVDNGAQTRRARADRLRGPALVAGGVVPRCVIIVDDVATTGATLRNAAGALRLQGCERVIGVVVARTLLKGPAVGSESPLRETPP